MTKYTLLASAAIFAMSVASVAPAMADDNTKFADFSKNAAIGSMFEIESSKLALAKSGDGEVKKFAQQMIDDHTKADAQFKAAVAAAGLNAGTLPTALDEKHQKMLDKLSRDEAGKSFDVDYTDMQHKAHQDAVKLYRDYAEKGDNATVRDFAGKTLPTLKMHEDTAANLDAKF